MQSWRVDSNAVRQVIFHSFFLSFFHYFIFFHFSLAFRSLIRNFGFAEVTCVRKCKKKSSFLLHFAHLFVTLHALKGRVEGFATKKRAAPRKKNMKKKILFSLVYRDMWQSPGKFQPRKDQLECIAPVIIMTGALPA